MATAKQFELMFQLTARLGPNFSQSFKNASKTMNALQSDLRNADQKLKDVSAYQKQQQAVAKSKTRVSELQAEHERLTREIEQTGQATPELTRKLQANEKALQKAQDATEKEERKLQDLSETLQEAGINTDNLGKDTEALEKQYQKLAETQQKVQSITEKQAANKEAIANTKTQLVGLTATVTAAGVAVKKAMDSTAEYADEIDKTSIRTGISRKSLQELQYAVSQCGGNFESVQKAVVNTNKQMLKVAQGNKTACTAYEELGVSVLDANGEMRDSEAVFYETVNALSKIQNQSERNARGLQIFGKSYADLAPLIDAGEGALQEYADEANRLGMVLTDEAIAANVAYTDSMDTMQRTVAGLKQRLATMLMPIVTKAAGGITEFTAKISDFVQKNPQTIATIGKIVAGLVGLKAGGLVAKLGFLQVRGGILSLQKAFTLVKGLGITKYLKNMTGGFGGLLKSVGPLVGIIAAVGGAIYYVSTHLEQVRGFIQKTFGDEGLAVFDKLWGIITQVGTAIKNAFFTSGSGVLDTLKGILPTIITTLQTGLLPLLPMIADLVMQIVPLIGQLITAILPVLGKLISAILPILATLIAKILPIIVKLISALLPIIMQIVQSVLPVLIQLVNTILPILTQIIQAVLPVIIQLIQTLLPIIQQIIDTVLPVFINLLNVIVPIFQNIIQAVLPVLQQLLQALVPIIQLLAEVFANVLGTALQSVANIVSSVMQVFQGLIDFITGVFTGNWSQAWEGIKSIFSGVFSGLGEIFKAPFKVIVSVINTVIRGLNKLKVPDWVPEIGGMGINIPEIPGFAKGTERTPSTFIAGENGPELITNAANRKVFTAAQTGQIFNNMAGAANLNTANNVNATAGAAGTITIHVTNSPSVTVTGGGDTSKIKEQLQQYDEEFLEKLRDIIRAILKEQKEQEGRVAYA